MPRNVLLDVPLVKQRWAFPMRRLALVLAAILATAVSAVSAEPPVTVFAAASLTEAFRAAADELRARRPDLRVEFNFAASSTLAQQIEHGAPADVFASADEANMTRLAGAGRVTGAPQVFARNRLTILVAPGNPKRITALADLGRPGLVVVLCAPSVPAGRYAADAFKRAGVALPQSSREAGVKAVVTKVSLGEADAGVAYVTDARAARGKVEEVTIPDPVNVVARYTIAVLKEAPNAAGGRAFVDFVLSDAGQAILGRFGYLAR